MLTPWPQPSPRAPLWTPGRDRYPQPIGWPTPPKSKRECAIAYRSSTSGTSAGSSTSIAYSGLAGLANDDIILVWCYVENQLSVSVAGSNTFTQFGQVNSAALGVQLVAFWSRANAVSGNITVSFTGSVFNEVVVDAYSGCITSGSPQDAAAVTSAPGSQNTIPLPSITTATNGAMVVGGGASVSSFSAPASPTDWTNVGSQAEMVTAYQLKATAGATTARSWSVSATDQVMSIVWALTPAGGGGPTGWAPLLSDKRNRLIV